MIDNPRIEYLIKWRKGYDEEAQDDTWHIVWCPWHGVYCEDEIRLASMKYSILEESKRFCYFEYHVYKMEPELLY